MAPEPKFHKLPKEVVRVSVPVAVSRRAKAKMAESGLRPPQYLTALMCRDVGLDPAEFGIDAPLAAN